MTNSQVLEARLRFMGIVLDIEVIRTILDEVNTLAGDNRTSLQDAYDNAEAFWVTEFDPETSRFQYDTP